MSQRRVARLIPIERMTLRYEHYRDPQEALRIRLRELAGSRVRYGYRRLTVLLKREGWEVNAKRIYRLYTEEGLIVRTKRRKERAQRQRVALGSALRPNQKWSMDFVAQRLSDGRWIRVLTVVDQYTRECVTLLADNLLSGEKVQRRWTRCCCNATHRSRSLWTTARSSLPKRSIIGLTGTVCIWTSSAQATGEERLHRKLQRQAARRVPERGGVLQPGRRTAETISLAARLQRRSTTQQPRL